MLSVLRSKAGMISSLTSLDGSPPLTLGIASYNLIFVQGTSAISGRFNVTTSSPADIQMKVLSGGFDLAFLLSLVLGNCHLALTFPCP
jgi:hypothetical protein